jgi:peptide/nickel transport system ATP-binding protein
MAYSEVAQAQPAGEVILRVKDLTVEFLTANGSATVANRVNLSLRSGETVGLVGESGSGKTVSALSILGLLPANGHIVGGEILYRGQDLLRASPEEMRSVRGREIGMIFQEPRRSLDSCFSVGEQIAEVLRAHQSISRRDAWKRAVEMMDRVQIPDAARRARSYPHQLSGGQCQRVMLAIALACRPSVLLADEPTTALDVTVQARMLDLILELQREMDLAVLLVTHDFGVVAETCDRVAVMYAGEVVEEGSTEAIFAGPRHPYTWGLLASVLGSGGGRERMAAIRGSIPPAHAWPEGCRFHPRCDFAVAGCRQSRQELISIGADRAARCQRVDEIVFEGRP